MKWMKTKKEDAIEDYYVLMHSVSAQISKDKKKEWMCNIHSMNEMKWMFHWSNETNLFGSARLRCAYVRNVSTKVRA